MSSQQGKFIEICLDRLRPELTAVATTVLDGQSFGELLDKAIARSSAPLNLMEAQPAEPEPTNKVSEPIEPDASELKGPMSKLRRW